MIFQTIFQGITVGLLLAIMIGPVFFTLLQLSISQGFRAGVVLASGVVTSDALYIGICFFGLSQLGDTHDLVVFLSFGGGILLALLGLVGLVRPPKVNIQPKQSLVQSNAHRWKLFLRGFGLNTMTPFVMLFWVANVSRVLSTGPKHWGYHVLYFGVILGTVFFTDVLKSYFSKKLRPLITELRMRNLNRIVSVALLLFGLRLFWHGLLEMGWTWDWTQSVGH